MVQTTKSNYVIKLFMQKSAPKTPRKKIAPCKSCVYKGLRDSDRTQTYNLLIRSQMLYSIKLQSRFWWCKYTEIFFRKTSILEKNLAK